MTSDVAVPNVEIIAVQHSSELLDTGVELLAIDDAWERHFARKTEPPPGLDPTTHDLLIRQITFLDSPLRAQAHVASMRAAVDGTLDVLTRFGFITSEQRAIWAERADRA